ncbi:16711_t:CDS:2, partial [Funneliformis mosseae]
RIEELETDSIIKNQDIKKLQQEFIDFKNRDKKSNNLSKNEKENEDLKTVKTLIDTNISNPQNFEDVQEIFKQLKSYHRALTIAERKNIARNERIQALEGLLKDSQNQLVTQSQRTITKKERERLEQTKSQISSTFSGLTFGSIAKPLRGGLSVHEQ